MFNINKLITRIRDSDKGRDTTPPTSPNRQQTSGSQAEDAEDQTTEGFLCPKCMEDCVSPELLQIHYESTHREGTDDQHICPICKSDFPTLDQLHIHYTTEHASSSAVNKGDLQSLKQEVAELHTTLREEKWYSEELKKEVSRLTNSVTSKEESEEVTMLRQQLKALEEGKSLLTAEVMLLRKQLGEAVELHNSVKEQKDAIEHKAAFMAGEKAELQARVDEERSIRAALEAKFIEQQELKTKLEVQLQQRPGADDVRVLRQELVQVQTLMDKMTRERELERDKLQQENQGLEIKIRQILQDLKETQSALSSAPTSTDVTNLQSLLSEKSSELTEYKRKCEEQLKERDTILNKLQNLEQSMSDKEKTLSKLTQEKLNLEELRARLEQKNKAGDETISEMKQKYEKLEETLLEVRALHQEKETEVESQRHELANQRDLLSSDITQKAQQLTESQHDIQKLMLKVQEKESQLKDMQRQLESLQIQYQNQTSANDDLNAQLWETKSELENESRLRKNGEEKLKEYEEAVSKHNELVEHLEEEKAKLYAKIEVGEGVNAAIGQLQLEKASLQEKLSEMQKSLAQQTEESSGTIEDLHKTVKQLKSQLQQALEKGRKDEAAISEGTAKLRVLEEKNRNLEESLKSKTEAMLTAETSWNKHKTDLEGLLKSVQIDIKNKNQELEKRAKELRSISDELGRCKESARSVDIKFQKELEQKSMLQTNVQALEFQLQEERNQLAERQSATKQLELQLAQVQSELVHLNENYNKKQSDYVEQLKNNENLKTSYQQQVEQLMGATSVLETKLNQLKVNASTGSKTLSSTVKILNKELANIKADFESNKEIVAKGLSGFRSASDQIGSLLLAQETEIRQRSAHEEQLQIQVNDLDGQNRQLENRISQTEAIIASQRIDLEQQMKTINDLNKQIDAKDSTTAVLQNQLQEMTQEKESLFTRYHDSESKFNQQTQTVENLLSEQKSLNEKLRDHLNEISKLKSELEQCLTELEESKQRESALNQSFSDISKKKVEMESKLQDLQQELLTKEKSLQASVVQNTSLETQLFNTQKGLSETEERNLNLDQEIIELRNHIIQQKNDLMKQISDLEEAKALLINQKLEIQNRLTKSDENLQREFASHEKTKESARNEKSLLEQNIIDYEGKLEALQESKNALKQEVEQQKTRYEMQIGTLQENLSTLRADFASHQESAKKLEVRVDELSGDKLELEAKLENALDERRALLERCLASESECEKLRVLTVELRRKLDDALSALHELGRENQTLQIETAKHTNRKWANDGDVANCTACQKLFSVTVRKHHCRNCGNIFCNECTSRSAMIASYKKPARVCDICYNDLTSK